MPYGDEIEVVKHECVGHVQKRMGTQLRTLKKSKTTDESRRPVKFGGKGRLTDKIIDKHQLFYGGTIGNHKNDLEGMEKAITLSPLTATLSTSTARLMRIHGASSNAPSLPERSHHHTPQRYQPIWQFM